MKQTKSLRFAVAMLLLQLPACAAEQPKQPAPQDRCAAYRHAEGLLVGGALAQGDYVGAQQAHAFMLQLARENGNPCGYPQS